LIKCSTSAASNYRAACLARSKADFVAKLSIAIEDVDEALFWIEFVVDEELMDETRVKPLLDEAKELAAILVASRKTAKDRSAEFTAGIRRGPNYR
jgi:four helix bundle protein